MSKLTHRLSGSIGMKQFARHYDNPYSLTQAEITKIIRTVNELLADKLALGQDVDLPQRLGTLELRKRNTRVDIVNGKVVEDYPIDWHTTKKYWEEDSEAKKNKVLIKHIVDCVYKVYYHRAKAVYNNKSLIEFFPSKKVKAKIRNNVREGIAGAFLMVDY